MNHLISIVVPVYNVELYIEKCINSIITQTHQNLEIILIDDGSTDNSGYLCDLLEKKDKRIKVYHIPNGGSSIARNFGLQKCQGDYIGFVDSDDWIRPNMFEVLLKFSIDNNLNVVECSSIDSRMEHKTDFNKDISNCSKIENRKTALKRILEYRRFAVWRRIYHHSIVKDRFFIEHILHQDVYYTLDIINESPKIGFIDFPFYIYNRENTDSVIRSNYSIKKLNSINAGAYVLENTKQYDSEIKSLAKIYLFNFLIYHYNSLFMFNELDPHFFQRSKIRQIFKTNLSLRTLNFYRLMVIFLPPKIYEKFLALNKTRIRTQVKFLKQLKNV
ncbi:glycosyltransferase [Formosa sp. S-31]|uniref:glycosyltransferase n=1 Tax=Formosa sp. S-31 TaxID=2790949 RepID=UPI003EBEF801